MWVGRQALSFGHDATPGDDDTYARIVFVPYRVGDDYYLVNSAFNYFLASQELSDNVASIDLKIDGTGPRTCCFYRIGTGEFTQLGQDLQSSFLSTDTAGGFQGVTLGMFAQVTSFPVLKGSPFERST